MEEMDWEVPKKCPKCKVNPGESMHRCPYDEDLNGDYSDKCNCCDKCRRGCAEDI